MNRRSERSLVAAAVAALNDLGVEAAAETETNPAVDAVVTLHAHGKPLRYRAEVKQRLTPSVIGSLTLTFPEGSLLITDYVTPPIADELRRRGIQFVDAAGNAFLNRRSLFVFVTGRRPRALHAPPKTLRVFRPSGLKVTFALLSVTELVSAPQRAIARAAGVSLGSVAPVLEGLRELGFIAEIRGTRHIMNRERLLQQWTEAYARLLEPSLELGRFSAASSDWWQHANLTLYGAQWGGETAAALLHRHLTPERSLIYAETTPASMLSRYRLKADRDGRVILRRRFWNDVPSPREDIVPPLLVYADLVAEGDARSLDAAKQIRDVYLYV